MKEFLVYTLLRLGLFLASWAVIAGVSALLADEVSTLWSLVLAAVVSAVASLYLLQAPRERFAARVEDRASAASQRFEESRTKEDTD